MCAMYWRGNALICRVRAARFEESNKGSFNKKFASRSKIPVSRMRYRDQEQSRLMFCRMFPETLDDQECVITSLAALTEGLEAKSPNQHGHSLAPSLCGTLKT